MTWIKFDNGKTIGKYGSEGGIIIADEEYEDEKYKEWWARISLEKEVHNGIPRAITLGIYGGRLLHTRFLNADGAMEQYEIMKIRLAVIIEHFIEYEEGKLDREIINQEITDFVDEFP